MNESVAKEALKGFLASYVKPCMPKTGGGAQPTVEEILRGVGTSEILRHRSRQLVLFHRPAFGVSQGDRSSPNVHNTGTVRVIDGRRII